MRAFLLTSLAFVGLIASACSSSPSAGDGVSVTIAAAQGGTVTSLNGFLTLEIPPGALDEDTQISITSAEPDDLPDSLRQLADPEMIYQLQPDGLRFNQAVTVTIDIPTDAFPAPESEEGIPIYALLTQDSEGDAEILLELEMTVSMAEGTGTISAKLEHFSWVVGQIRSMKVSISDMGNLDVGIMVLSASGAFNIAAPDGDQIIDLNGTYLTDGPIIIDSTASPNIDFVTELDPGEDTLDTFSLTCLAPGTGIYTLQATAKFHTPGADPAGDIAVTIYITGDVQCTVPTPTPTPTLLPPLPPVPVPTHTPTPTPVETSFRARGVYSDGDGGCGYPTSFVSNLDIELYDFTIIIHQPITGDWNMGPFDLDGSFFAFQKSPEESYDGIIDLNTLIITAINIYTDSNGCTSQWTVVITPIE